MILTSPVPPTIKLSHADWRWATWRPYTPLPREIPLFDKEAALAKLSRSRGKYHFLWSTLDLSPVMSPPEAHFWLEAMTYISEKYPYYGEEIAASLKSKIFDARPSFESMKANFTGKLSWTQIYDNSQIIIPLVNLLTFTELMELMNVPIWLPFPGLHITPLYRNTFAFVRGFQDYLIPYLTDEERADLRAVIRDDVVASPLPGHYGIPDLTLFLAAAIGGFSSELEAKMESLPDDCFSQPQKYFANIHNVYEVRHTVDVVFGLDDPIQVERQMRRLKLRCTSPHQATAWIAHTETKALDWIYDAILQTNKQFALPLFRVLALVEDEAVVPFMLKLRRDGPVQVQAIEWLNTHTDVGARGAATVFAMGGVHGNDARAYLRTLKSKGHLDLLSAIQLDGAQDRSRAEVIDYAEESLPLLTPNDTPAWLAEAVSAVEKEKRVKLPAWLDAGELPPLSISGRILNREQIEALLIALNRSTLETAHPLVKAIKTHIDVMIRDAFVWTLFDLWSGRGASSKDKWALMAVGLLGGDASVMKLTPLIRKWPGEAQHQRAVLGLDCLRAIGTDTALTQINNIGQKVQFKALKSAAQKAIKAIAEERGMSSEELADRIVPDCGLDADGRRTFDYGTRQFMLVINSELKPMIRGEDGKLKPDLPKPNSSDDPERAAIAQAEWKLIKKQVRDVAKLQGIRLENAMMARRTWKPDEFKMLLVDHPLLIHLVKSLIWGGFDASHKLLKTFRVTDEKDYADANDDPITLDGVTRIGLVHPLQVAPAEISAWGQVLSDYDRMPPFVQLSRKTYALEPNEIDAVEITRYKDVKIEAVVLVGVLQKLGWQRGMPADGGVYFEHSKPFPDDNVTAIVRYEGVPIGFLQGWPDQTIDSCFFVSGVYRANEYGPMHKERVKLGAIDRVVMSEVLRDLALLSHKGGK